MTLARIGATDKGGVRPPGSTDPGSPGRDLVACVGPQVGCTVRIDAIGNIFMRRAGRRDDLPPVMTGSHIDTQPTGGKFDGNYGVLAGIEVLRTLHAHGIATEAPVEVVVWTNEEGSRFVPVMMGSGVFAGAFTLAHALGQRDRDGISVDEAPEGHRLRRRGAVGGAAPWPPTSRRISSEAPSWRPTSKTIGAGARRAGAALVRRYRQPAWRPTPVRRPWSCAMTPCWPPPTSSNRGEPRCPGIRAACPWHGRLPGYLSQLAQCHSGPRTTDGGLACRGRRHADRDGRGLTRDYCKTARRMEWHRSRMFERGGLLPLQPFDATLIGGIGGQRARPWAVFAGYRRRRRPRCRLPSARGADGDDFRAVQGRYQP